MPAQKLSYKVDVDTGSAVRDLERLGTAGADAGQDIADGFDKAGSASKAALAALGAYIDKRVQDAKELGVAVSAIKAHLTVDVDDSKVAGFVSDLKNKMGVAFDDITADAKQFADVLERGVNMERTTSELRNVGSELDTVRNNSDQSRSVLANMAGNVTQDLGELGGVVGSLGVGIGQLAEYATEGNIGLRDLGKVAGPLAALTAASFVIQGMSKGLADLKKAQDAYRQQQEDFNDTLRETGSLQDTVNQMLEENTQLSAAPELNWWQGMMDDLPVLTGMVDETATSQSGLIEAMAAAGITADEFAHSLDHGLGPVIAFQAAVKDMADSGQITQEQYDLLINQQALYSETALKAEVQQQNLNEVFGDGTTTMAAYEKAMPSPEALEAIAAEQRDLADAAEAAALAIREQGENAHAAYQIMRGGDWGAAKVEAATSVMQDFFGLQTENLHRVGTLSAAYAGLGDALKAAHDAGAEGVLPNMTTPEGRATLDALDNLATALIPSIADAFDRSHGNIARFKSSMTDLYQSTLTGLSRQLDISTDDTAKLLAQIGLTPDNFDTIYTLSGTEEAQLKLQLLQGQIDKLPDYVQTEVRQLIIEGDYVGALDRVQRAFAAGAKVPLHADDSGLYKSVAGFQSHVSRNPVVVPLVTRGVVSYGKGSVSVRGAAAAPAGVGVEPMAADTGGGVSTFAVAAPSVTVTPPPINITLNAGVVGNRYELARWIRASTRDQQRLGRVS